MGKSRKINVLICLIFISLIILNIFILHSISSMNSSIKIDDMSDGGRKELFPEVETDNDTEIFRGVEGPEPEGNK